MSRADYFIRVRELREFIRKHRIHRGSLRSLRPDGGYAYACDTCRESRVGFLSEWFAEVD